MRVLIPIDGSRTSLYAVEHLVRCPPGGEPLDVELVHVLPPIPRYASQFVTREALAGYRRDLASAALAPAMQALARARIAHRAHVATGSPAAVVARRAAATGSDRIVVGTRRRNALLRLIEGSFSIRLLELTTVPVELVPGDRPSVL
jgi:nucleotide-binding universal stress UspA family protein